MRFLVRSMLFVGLLAFLAVGGFVLYFDYFARTGVESGASWALGVETRLSSLRLRPVAGRIGIGGLRVANPPGYEQPSFLELSSGRVLVDIWTIRDDVIEIPRIELSGLEIAIEQTRTGTNYDVILANLDRASGTPEPEKPGTGQKVVVRELVIRDITAHTRLRTFGRRLPDLDIDVPEIRLTNLGEDGGGIEIAELTGIVTRAVLLSVARKSGALPVELARGLKGRLGSSVVGTITDEVAAGAERAIRKGLGRLLGGKGDEE